MRVIIEEKDLKNIRFSIEKVCDRRYVDLPEEILMENAVRSGRMDQVRIVIHINKFSDTAAFVEPFNGSWYFSWQTCVALSECTEKLQSLIRDAWEKDKDIQKWCNENLNYINAVYEKYGGEDAYFKQEKVVREAFKKRKIAVATKYAAMFADKEQHSALHTLLKSEDVYRNIPKLLTSGFDHMLWIYETYVAKEITTLHTS